MRRHRLFPVTLTLLCIGVLFAAIALDKCEAAQPVKMEILFMNHGPMQPTIRTLKLLLGKYSGKIQASWFDFDTQSGKAFMHQRGIQGHIPLLIFINGVSTYDIGGKQVTFMSFPSGAGPYQFQGRWTFEDLDEVLQSLAR